MIKLTKHLIVTVVSSFILFSLTGCDLSSSSGSSSAELDEQVQERLAGAQEQAAATTAAKPSSSSSSASSSSSSGGGSGGFLWKPKSESNGKLVVLLPGSLRGKVSGASISGSFGSENGSFAGDTHNGRRPHYRFSKSGGSYGSNIRVTARTSSGTKSWTVPNGGSRNEQ
ncbi:MAG: hypothetical protein ACI9QL_003635 [Candidatus Omnitrophota bacterium]|jgi:hypothetical protein